MFKKIILSSLFFLLFFSSVFFSVAKCQAQDALSGLETTAGEVTAFSSQNPGENFISTAAGKIIGTALSFVGVLFLILMIMAGITWMTAAGNDQQTKKAKDLLVSSIIGIIIVFAAYAITAFVGNFVSSNLSG
jgi:hypothetical protein